MQNEDKNRNILQEFLSQYMLFKSYGVLGWVQKRVGDTYAQKQKYVGKLSVLQGAIGFLNNFLGVGMFIIALGMGSFLVVRGETTVGTLIAVVNLVSFFYGPFLHISGWMAEVNEVKVSTNRIGEMRIMVKIKIGTTTIMTTASFHSRRNIKIKLTTNVKLSKKMLGMSVLE